MINTIRLRAWQVRALALWKENNGKGIVQVATGGGKTIFAQACIQDSLSLDPNLRVVIVVPTVSLADQWIVCLMQEYGFSESQVTRDLSEILKGGSCIVCVSIIDTFRRKVSLLGDKAERIFLIVDECHRAGSERNSAIFSAKYKKTLGLSATPERQYDNALEDHIIPGLGPILISYTLTDAYADGILSPFTITNVYAPLLPDEQDKYNKLTSRIIRLSRKAKPTPDDFEKLKSMFIMRARLVNTSRLRMPIAVKYLLENQGRRTILFHEDIDVLSRIVATSKRRNISICEYHSKVSRSMRLSNLKLFRKGVFDVIASCHALDEGVNIPEAELAIIVSSTATVRQRVQRLGRVLRKSENKNAAEVVTFYSTEAEKKRLSAEAENLSSEISVTWRTVSL